MKTQLTNLVVFNDILEVVTILDWTYFKTTACSSQELGQFWSFECFNLSQRLCPSVEGYGVVSIRRVTVEQTKI